MDTIAEFTVFFLPDLGRSGIASYHARHFLAKKSHYRHTCCLTWTSSGDFKNDCLSYSNANQRIYVAMGCCCSLGNISSGDLFQATTEMKNRYSVLCSFFLPLSHYSIKFYKKKNFTKIGFWLLGFSVSLLLL